MNQLEMLSGDRFEMENQRKVREIEACLQKFLPQGIALQKTISDAMEYSLMGGGKRLRPMFMKEVYLLFGGEEDEVIEPFMAAIEMIHTYSLVHDDLPAMDNDDYRRGRLTTHKVYGEDMGILCGDALLNYAYETALTGIEKAKDIKAAVAALEAGVDMILCPEDFQAALAGVIQAVEDGRLDEARIDESVLRILRVKVPQQPVGQ